MKFAVEIGDKFSGHIHFLAIPPSRRRSIAYTGNLNAALDSKFTLLNKQKLHFANLNYAEFMQFGEILPRFFGKDNLHFSQTGAEALRRKIEEYCRNFYKCPATAHTDLTQVLLDTNLDATVTSQPRTPPPMPPTMKPSLQSTPLPRRPFAKPSDPMPGPRA